jgi:GDP-L-fucose synthase
MKKILILGCSGFIGKNLGYHFSKKKNYKVYGTYLTKKPNIKNIKFYKHNILNRFRNDKLFNNKDIVINCAAVTSGAKDIVKKPYIHVTDNNIINSIVLESAFNKKVKHLIMLSCTLMYKSSAKLVKEKDLNLNEKIYPKYHGGAWVKLSMEKITEFFSTISKTKFSVIRHSNLYGPFDKFDLKKSHVFGATINKVINSKKQITVLGQGKEKRDLLYIGDFVDFIDRIIKKQKKNFRIYNCGYGNFISVKSLVKKIIFTSKKNLKIKHDNSFKSLNTSIRINSGLAKKELGWKPKTSLEEGIQKTIEWYKTYYKI